MCCFTVYYLLYSKKKERVSFINFSNANFRFISLVLLNSPYLNWNYNDPENAVLGVAFHSFEWIFIRVAPIIIIGLAIGIILTRKKN